MVLDGSIAVWSECHNRAEIFLDLGVNIIRCLQPIKIDLLKDAEEILFVIRMKLNAIKSFHPIFRHQTQYEREGQGPIRPHSFVDLLELFVQDGPSPTNVAEAYLEADNSVCEAVIRI